MRAFVVTASANPVFRLPIDLLRLVGLISLVRRFRCLPDFAASQAGSGFGAASALLLHQWRPVYRRAFIIKNNVSSFFNMQTW
jgi:hypothetical protein